MSHVQVSSRQTCRVLAVVCGKLADRLKDEAKHGVSYPFPELVSSGRLEVLTLKNPTIDEFQNAQKSFGPNFLYVQGEQLENDEQIGRIIWGTSDVSDPQMFSSLIGPSFPTIIYLEVLNGGAIAHALHSKGVPYVIYWEDVFSSPEAFYFRQALLSVIQSSCSHTWDAFQVASASLRLYCGQGKLTAPADEQKVSASLAPRLLGNTPRISIPQQDVAQDLEGECSSDTLPSIKIHDDALDVRFLVCGVPCTLDACWLESLEDGLNALLNIEIRGSALHNRVSAAPPPLQVGTFTHGVVTMRCDFTTCTFAYISLLVSGSAQTCFDDQLLECHIKNELIEKTRLVHALPSCEKSRTSWSEPLNYDAIAGGAPVFEVDMKVPAWAVQVLKQLALDVSYRSLVTLGIASIQGTPVASFEKDDADRIHLFSTKQGMGYLVQDKVQCCLPSWSPNPIKKRTRPSSETDDSKTRGGIGVTRLKIDPNNKDMRLSEGTNLSFMSARKRLKVAVMRPVPHIQKHKLLPFTRKPETDTCYGSQLKGDFPVMPPVKHKITPSAPVTHRRSMASSFQAQQIISLNPLPMKKHGCDRSPILVCSEEEFLRDVMQFLILRGHSRLVPQGGISEFPDVILNAKRLDLYNLYREVVSRGGFYVGNGINWKGQVFPKMRNHTITNRMTGVGNTLKRHYETYLLEYELAHDDVDGECCLLCQSSAPGDWVNCGLCGEWAHFGCDRRQGLGTFKDYAKTDGLEYICPRCSLTKNYRKKPLKIVNGFSDTPTVPQHV